EERRDPDDHLAAAQSCTSAQRAGPALRSGPPAAQGQDLQARHPLQRHGPRSAGPRRAGRHLARGSRLGARGSGKMCRMAARATWKGHLEISMVTIPIKVFPATESSATISFNQLHGECNTRIQQKRWCPKCEREVPNTDLVKGYEYEKGQYVVLDE